MNTRPKALRLADKLEAYYEDRFYNEEKEAAAELRRQYDEIKRLHKLNAELLKEMRYIASISNGQVSRVARAVISRTESTLKTE